MNIQASAKHMIDAYQTEVKTLVSIVLLRFLDKNRSSSECGRPCR